MFNRTKTYVKQEAVRKALANAGLDFWVEDVEAARGPRGESAFVLVIRDHDLSFDTLQQISDVFGTKNINVGSDTRDDGYCETCSSPYSVSMVYVNDATKVVV